MFTDHCAFWRVRKRWKKYCFLANTSGNAVLVGSRGPGGWAYVYIYIYIHVRILYEYIIIQYYITIDQYSPYRIYLWYRTHNRTRYSSIDFRITRSFTGNLQEIVLRTCWDGDILLHLLPCVGMHPWLMQHESKQKSMWLSKSQRRWENVEIWDVFRKILPSNSILQWFLRLKHIRAGVQTDFKILSDSVEWANDEERRKEQIWIVQSVQSQISSQWAATGGH